MTEIVELMSMTRVTDGNLSLVGLSFDSVDDLADLATRPIHPADYMPFSSPWSAGTVSERRDRLRRWYATRLAAAVSDEWTFIFRVLVADATIGSTNLYARNFATYRSVSTGSWLIQEAQGHGVGTRMRQLLLTLAFEHLGAHRATSEAWSDNWPSRRVNETCGYTAIGEYPKRRGNEWGRMVQYELRSNIWMNQAPAEHNIEIIIHRDLPDVLLSQRY